MSNFEKFWKESNVVMYNSPDILNEALKEVARMSWNAALTEATKAVNHGFSTDNTMEMIDNLRVGDFM